MNVDAQPYSKTLGLRCLSLMSKVCLHCATVMVLERVKSFLED